MKTLKIENINKSNWTGETISLNARVLNNGDIKFNHIDETFTLTTEKLDSLLSENSYAVTLHGTGWEDPLVDIFIETDEIHSDETIDRCVRRAVGWISNHI